MNKDKNYFFNCIFIIVFIVMIILSLICINRDPDKISQFENKVLAKKPELWGNGGKINESYIIEFEDWFDDNIGFKEQALTANIIFKNKIFHVLDIPNWLMGKDNNLFYTTGGEDIATFTGTNMFSEEAMLSITENLNYLNQYFEQQGCQTYNMFIPNKEAIYSELYDENIYHAENSRMDVLIQFVADHTNLNIVNLKNALLANKQDQLYFKSYDASHWNMNGAFIGYQELMYSIKEKKPDIQILSKQDFDIEEENFKGLMSYYTDIKAVHNSFNFEDTIFNYNLRGGYHAIMEETGPGGMILDPNLNFYHFYNENADTKETLFIVGDSYMYCFMLPMLAESFKDVYFIRNTDASLIVQLAKIVKPSIFVFEVVERVCSEGYFDIMSDYSGYLNFQVDLSDYVPLGIVPEVHIDAPCVTDGAMLLEDNFATTILGWVFDIENNIRPKEVLIRIDNLYRRAKFYYREDLTVMGKSYGDCGFEIRIENELLKNAEVIDIIVITEKNEIYDAFPIIIEK